jgi:Bifunctional DNA primase/polymerase, N-terminal
VTPQQAALAYARRGLAVFPVRSRGKVPLIPSCHPGGDPARGVCRGECGQDGHGCWDATAGLDAVRAWWARWPNANIGIRTGECFDVLDPDKAEGIAAVETFAAEHGFSLERGPWVPTPGGGRHYYFAPTGLPGSKPLPSVDWKAAGGYVVVGPSTHPNGRAYAEIPVEAYRPPFVPAALRELLEPPKVEPAPARATYRPADTTTRYARAALDGTQARILAASRGERNDVAFKQAASLFGLVAGGVVSEAEAAAMLEDVMRAVGLGPREVAATIASARRRGMQRPRGIPADPAPPRMVPPPGAVLSEDAFTAWTNGKAQVAPCLNAPPPMAAFPSRRLLDIYRMLEWKSQRDRQGRRVQENVSHEHLMRHYRVSRTTVEGELRRLEERDALRRERIPAERQPDGRDGRQAQPVRPATRTPRCPERDDRADHRASAFTREHRGRTVPRTQKF